MFRPPTPVVKNLLIINIGIAVAQYLVGLDLGNIFGLYFIFSDEFMPFQFFTYMFLHSTFSPMHLIGNMLGLYFFGPLLEDFLGQKKFIFLYIVTGVGAGIIYTGVNFVEVNAVKQDVETYINNPNPEDFNRLILEHGDGVYSQVRDFIDRYARDGDVGNNERQSVAYARQLYGLYGNYNMVGASGAIFGVLAAFALFFPNTEVMLLFFPVPIKAKYLVGAFILFEIYSEMQRAPDDTVAHWAHLGGAIIAWLLVTRWKKDRSSFY
jgi:membrane associated rhomboid family serine protease